MKKEKKHKKKKNICRLSRFYCSKYLLFLALLTYFEVEKMSDMTTDEKFEILCDRLADADAGVHYVADFTTLCEELHLGPELADNMLYGLFGMSAEEICAKLMQIC